MGRVQSGDGITGTTIKDPGTKSRARVEVGSPGVGWSYGEKRHTTVIDNNKKYKI